MVSSTSTTAHGTATDSALEALRGEPNTSVLLVSKRNISIEPIPLPTLEPDGVLIRVMANGICGSDMHSYLAGGVGGRPIKNPSVMGHEAAGIVEAVGADVTTHKRGDRVALEPGLPCRRCVNCKSGRSNICLHIYYCGVPGNNGTLSRFYTVPSDMAPHIPDSLSWDEAGSIQPLAIGVQIGIRAEIRAHKTVAIFGCGPIGLITAATSHAYSASRIIAFDIQPSRVDFARKYLSPMTGKPIIDHVYLLDEIPKPAADASAPAGHEEPTPGDKIWAQAEANMRRIMDDCGLTAEGGVDVVVEASGAQDSMMHGISICKQGGVVLQVGLGHIQTHLIPTIAITNKEIDYRGLTRYTASCFPSAIDLLRRGVVDLKPLITASYPLTRAKDALEAVAAGKDMKIIIHNQE